jgi:hypothetical protein
MTTTSSTPIPAPPTASNGAAAVPVALRDRIKAAPNSTPTELYEAEAWGVMLEVRSMTVATKTAVTEKATRDDDLDMGIMLPAILIATCFDPETGEHVFTDADTGWLSDQPAGVIEEIATVGLRLSGLSKALVAATDVIEGKSGGS